MVIEKTAIQIPWVGNQCLQMYRKHSRNISFSLIIWQVFSKHVSARVPTDCTPVAALVSHGQTVFLLHCWDIWWVITQCVYLKENTIKTYCACRRNLLF